MPWLRPCLLVGLAASLLVPAVAQSPPGGRIPLPLLPLSPPPLVESDPCFDPPGFPTDEATYMLCRTVAVVTNTAIRVVDVLSAPDPFDATRTLTRTTPARPIREVADVLPTMPDLALPVDDLAVQDGRLLSAGSGFIVATCRYGDDGLPIPNYDQTVVVTARHVITELLLPDLLPQGGQANAIYAPEDYLINGQPPQLTVRAGAQPIRMFTRDGSLVQVYFNEGQMTGPRHRENRISPPVMAEVVYSSSYADVAVLTVPVCDLPVARFGDSNGLATRQQVISTGASRGIPFSIRSGEFEGTYPAGTVRERFIVPLRHGADINQGNSGGPLWTVVNGLPVVVGMNTFLGGANICTPNGICVGSPGESGAVPSNDVLSVLRFSPLGRLLPRIP